MRFRFLNEEEKWILQWNGQKFICRKGQLPCGLAQLKIPVPIGMDAEQGSFTAVAKVLSGSFWTLALFHHSFN